MFFVSISKYIRTPLNQPTNLIGWEYEMNYLPRGHDSWCWNSKKNLPFLVFRLEGCKIIISCSCTRTMVFVAQWHPRPMFWQVGPSGREIFLSFFLGGEGGGGSLLLEMADSSNVPVKSKPKHRNIAPPPPPSFAGREGGNFMKWVFPGVGHLITTHRGWGIWSQALISCYIALIPRGVITSLDTFKAKDTWFLADWLKSKGLYISFALYLKVFKNHLYYLRYVRVSINPCLHWKVSQGGGIWSPGMDL